MSDLHARLTGAVETRLRAASTDMASGYMPTHTAMIIAYCERDLRVLDRHRVDPAKADGYDRGACMGCGTDDRDDPVAYIDTDPRHEQCPELMDLAAPYEVEPT